MGKKHCWIFLSRETNHKQLVGKRHAFTLVELLVVIAIIGVLIALLLPAVQAAREAARRMSCKNTVKQLALGCLLHEEANGSFPSGGWGWAWLGDPDQGFGKSQPGGWAYSILPYIEQSALHDLGSGATEAEKRTINTEMVQDPINSFTCTSRRGVDVHRVWQTGGITGIENADTVFLTMRTDYAINAGSVYITGLGGPSSIAAGISQTSWAAHNVTIDGTTFPANGVSYQASEVKIRRITDGMTATYLVGEKYVHPDNYAGGDTTSVAADSLKGDNMPMYVGHDFDVMRWVGRRPDTLDDVFLPQSDGDVPTTDNTDGFSEHFGSAHPGGLNMAFCDGSVQYITYDIDAAVHLNRGTRDDGRVDGEAPNTVGGGGGTTPPPAR